MGWGEDKGILTIHLRREEFEEYFSCQRGRVSSLWDPRFSIESETEVVCAPREAASTALCGVVDVAALQRIRKEH